ALTAAVRLARLLQAAAFNVEQPAMVAAADAALLDLAVVERRAAMAAARIDQARPAGAVAEQDQLLAEHLDGARRGSGVGRHAHGMPVAAQQLAHRRAAADLGKARVIGRSL